MPVRSYTNSPMALGNVRENGVHCLDGVAVVLSRRRRAGREYVDNVPVPWFGPRVVCTCCGIVGADADRIGSKTIGGPI